MEKTLARRIPQDQARTDVGKVFGTTALVLAGVAVAPLIAFALLWTSLMVVIGATWVMHLLGLA